MLLPHVIVGDEALTLKKYLMRPYPGNVTKDDETNKNYSFRVFRARLVVENVFVILTQKLRIFYARINMKPENVEKSYSSCICIT